jgi:hypothetical protein
LCAIEFSLVSSKLRTIHRANGIYLRSPLQASGIDICVPIERGQKITFENLMLFNVGHIRY